MKHNMHEKDDMYDIKKELESIINRNIDLPEEKRRKILACLLDFFEKRSGEIFMEGYRYAISVLEDGIVKKSTGTEISE